MFGFFYSNYILYNWQRKSNSGSPSLIQRPPTPIKEIMNLTTAVHLMTFNHDGQILSIASKDKKDAVKCVHLPSLTVFSNWPTNRSPIHYPSSLDFSNASGYMAIGNDRGRVLLYRLRHYPSV